MILDKPNNCVFLYPATDPKQYTFFWDDKSESFKLVSKDFSISGCSINEEGNLILSKDYTIRILNKILYE